MTALSTIFCGIILSPLLITELFSIQLSEAKQDGKVFVVEKLTIIFIIVRYEKDVIIRIERYIQLTTTITQDKKGLTRNLEALPFVAKILLR